MTTSDKDETNEAKKVNVSIKYSLRIYTNKTNKSG